MAKLTKTYIDNIKPPDKGQKLIYDDELKGFGIRVTKTAKVYICQGRVKGRVKRVKIGNHGAWTLDNARKKAREYLVNMANGIDPNQEKKVQAVRALTLEEVKEDYIKSRNLKESSIKDYNKHLNGIFKEWKDQPITVIDREGVKKLFEKASKASKAQANQAFRILRSLINYAMENYRPGNKPIILENPVKVLSATKRWHSIKPRNSKITTDKIGRAWNCIQQEMSLPVQNHTSKSIIDLIAFLLLTGCRIGEARALKWENVNLQEAYWFIHDPKNNNPVTLPLSSQSLQVLKERPVINEYVFSRESGKGHVSDVRFTMKKINQTIGIHLTPHDLRRTFRAIAGECGIELWKTKLLMNHKLNQDVTISAYTETSDLRYLKKEIQMIGDWIEKQAPFTENSNNENLMDILFPEFST
jgi:integrase